MKNTPSENSIIARFTPFRKKDAQSETPSANWSLIFKNGYYIPFVHLGLYYVTGDALLSTIIALKAYPANYYYWYSDHYRYLGKYNWIRQFVKFTDTGHAVSLLYWISPEFLPLAFTVHFSITGGFWGGKLLFNMKDQDLLSLPEIDSFFEQMWSSANHGLHLLILSQRLYYDCVPFTYTELQYSLLWLYGWFFGIYIPWRMLTGDCVYEVLSIETPIKNKIFIGFAMSALIVLGHISGYGLTRALCKSTS